MNHNENLKSPDRLQNELAQIYDIKFHAKLNFTDQCRQLVVWMHTEPSREVYRGKIGRDNSKFFSSQNINTKYAADATLNC